MTPYFKIFLNIRNLCKTRILLQFHASGCKQEIAVYPAFGGALGHYPAYDGTPPKAVVRPVLIIHPERRGRDSNSRYLAVYALPACRQAGPSPVPRAERARFELAVRFPTHAFQACALNHSATSPLSPLRFDSEKPLASCFPGALLAPVESCACSLSPHSATSPLWIRGTRAH